MAEPGGGHGWRAERHMPRQRGGLLGYGRLAERALPGEDRPLCVLLLTEGPARDPIERLLAAPGVVGVDPPRLSYRAAARLPAGVADGLAAVQARRMKLPGVAYAVAMLEPLQLPLARALLAVHRGAELWYGGDGDEPPHAFRFDPSGLEVWERMERLGIESGRLGSERPDIR
jgi:hypothetical protein